MRLFSKRVCDKVKEKGETTYKNVANELVEECKANNEKVREENVKRRVYDAINVLVAMGIIERKKDKQIEWVGLPRTHSEEDIVAQGKEYKERIQSKKEILEDLKQKHYLYSSLIERNKKRKLQDENDMTDKLTLPFVLIRTPNTTDVQCSYSTDLSVHSFHFSDPFYIFEDSDTLASLEESLRNQTSHSSDQTHP